MEEYRCCNIEPDELTLLAIDTSCPDASSSNYVNVIELNNHPQYSNTRTVIKRKYDYMSTLTTAPFNDEEVEEVMKDCATPVFEDELPRQILPHACSSRHDHQTTATGKNKHSRSPPTTSPIDTFIIIDGSSPSSITRTTPHEGSSRDNRPSVLMPLTGSYLETKKEDMFEKTKLKIRFLSAKFEPDIEPFFFSIALYDVRQRVKLSETFYFQSATDKLEHVVGHGHFASPHVAAMVDIDEPSVNMFFIIRIEKLFQSGDLMETLEAYNKTDGKNFKSVFDKFDQYRMPVGWNAIGLRSLVKSGSQEQSQCLKSSSLDRRGQVQYGGSSLDTLRRTRDESIGRRPSASNAIIRNHQNVQTDESVFFKCSATAGENQSALDLSELTSTIIPLDSCFKQEIDRISDWDLMKILDDSRRSTLLKRFRTIPMKLKLGIVNCTTTTKTEQRLETSCSGAYPLLNFQAPIYPLDYTRNVLLVYAKRLSTISYGRVGGSPRNILIKIQVLVSETNDGQQRTVPLKCLENHSYQITDTVYLPIQYHNRNPQFYDEFKVFLPDSLNSTHHLFFTFFHLSCQRKDDNMHTKNIIGYSWLPIHRSVMSSPEELNLPISTDLPANYFLSSPFCFGPSVKWMDNRRPIFSINLKLLSSSIPDNENVEDFLSLKVNASSQSVYKALQQLATSELDCVVKFSRSIFDKLLVMIANEHIGSPSMCCLVELVGRIQSTCSGPYLEALQDYVKSFARIPTDYQCNSNTDHGAFSRRLLIEWAYLSNDTQMQSVSTCSWFLFKLLLRALCFENLIDAGIVRIAVKASVNLIGIVNILVRVMVALAKSEDDEKRTWAGKLSAAIADFTFDSTILLTIEDVLDMIQSYTEAAIGGGKVLTACLIRYLQVICSHEHVLTVNHQSLSTNRSSVKTSCGIIVDSIHGLIQEVTTNYESDRDMLTQTVDIICTLFYLNERMCRKQLRNNAILGQLALFFHQVICTDLLRAVQGSLKKLFDEKPGQSTPARIQDHSKENTICVNPVALAFLNKSRSRCSKHTLKSGSDARKIAICFLWTIKYIGRSSLEQLWREMSVEDLDKILLVLFSCISLFENKNHEDPIHVSCPSTTEMPFRRSRRDQLLSTKKNRTIDVVFSKQSSTAASHNHNRHAPSISKLKSNAVLCSECSLIVLEGLNIIIRIATNSTSFQDKLSTVMNIVLKLMSTNQSIIVRMCALALQRSLVSKFPGNHFASDDQSTELFYRLLKCSCSNLAEIRASSVGSLYSILRKSFELDDNFSQVKFNMLVTLNTMAGHEDICFDAHLLEQSLVQLVERSSCQDHGSRKTSSSFGPQLKRFYEKLSTVMTNTRRLRQRSEEPELTIDLMHRIAECYQNSAEQRILWLQSIAQNHLKLSNFMEAGQCLLHASGIIAENLAEDYHPILNGCVSLTAISQNVIEESAVFEDAFTSPSPVFKSTFMSEQGFFGLMEQAAMFFVHAQAFELCNEIYKILIKFYEANNDYKRVAAMHAKLQDYFSRIASYGNKRAFATYFRVGFHGRKIGDQDNVEYVYKERPFTKLPEIADRIEAALSSTYGKESVCIIKDSKTVDRDCLDLKNLIFVQITYVEPHLDLAEMVERPTHFLKNHGLNRFVYSTPFTMSGRPRGSVTEQYQRKTIVTTTHMFPYFKCRIPILHSEQTVLTPIEVAIEDIQNKVTQLRQAIDQDPADAKLLQVILQGCIGTTVNKGPLELANQFLLPASRGQVKPCRLHHKLRTTFKEFMYRCTTALKCNSALIGSDQADYHKELEKNFESLNRSLVSLLKPFPTQ